MIDSFSGKFEFLSNFHPSELTVDGKVYETLEHAFQAAKTSDPDMEEKIRTAPTASAAKKLGRQAKLDPNWEQVKVQVMEDLVRQKFQNHLNLKFQLLLTGNQELVEGNTWKDTFWGVTKDGVGENHLGRILMKIRHEIRSQDKNAWSLLLQYLDSQGLTAIKEHLEVLMDEVEYVVQDDGYEDLADFVNSNLL